MASVHCTWQLTSRTEKTDRQTDRDTETERGGGRETETETKIIAAREAEGDRETKRDGDRETETKRDAANVVFIENSNEPYRCPWQVLHVIQ